MKRIIIFIIVSWFTIAVAKGQEVKTVAIDKTTGTVFWVRGNNPHAAVSMVHYITKRSDGVHVIVTNKKYVNVLGNNKRGYKAVAANVKLPNAVRVFEMKN